jgi:hypothetical protein
VIFSLKWAVCDVYSRTGFHNMNSIHESQPRRASALNSQDFDA